MMQDKMTQEDCEKFENLKLFLAMWGLPIWIEMDDPLYGESGTHYCAHWYNIGEFRADGRHFERIFYSVDDLEVFLNEKFKEHSDDARRI